MVKLYEVGVVYKEDHDTHRESELLVFKNDLEAENYIRKGAVKALFTLVPIEKLDLIAKKYFKKVAEEITGEMIDTVTDEMAVKLFEDLKKLATNPTVDKFYIEVVEYFEDANGKKYPIELKAPKEK
jgi:hypothetical protein